ncbi:MAG: hypothetical protein VX335_05230 [Pseudomonadota bacterium]|nr:hypothetical protein [Pseudomonadota bacterium]
MDNNAINWSLLSTGIYFALTGITYGLVLLMPSVLVLPTYQSYFALLGVVGLASTILYTILTDNLAHGLYVGVTDFLLNIVPFFIAIACGQSSYIALSFLNMSAINISILTGCCIKFLTACHNTENNYAPVKNNNQFPQKSMNFIENKVVSCDLWDYGSLNHWTGDSKNDRLKQPK